MYAVSDFDYDLPENLIAQFPAQKRDFSRMMVINKTTGKIEDKIFRDICDYFTSNDILVLNNTKVIPARIFGKKKTGAKIEFLLLKRIGEKTWKCLIKPLKRVKIGDIIEISDDFSLEILEKNDEAIVKLICPLSDYEALEKYGKMPLPPYIERCAQNEDKNRYQTVFADKEGSAASPTAGLHFTKEILKKLEDKGVKIVCVTLNIGLGTFRPVKCEKIQDHKMHFETYEITQNAADTINRALKESKKITAVGTTCVRTLESCFRKNGKIVAGVDETDIFIYPPYEFKVIQRLLTNFHLPKSTLLMLVSAFMGFNLTKKCYEYALRNKYRFFSYGDCMFIIS